VGYFEVIILAIIEGLTEFLPISSTGHMLIAKKMMHIDAANMETVNIFIVAVQFGAIFAVPVVFYKKFFSSFDFYLKLLVGFIPAGLIGFALSSVLEDLLDIPLILVFTFTLVGVLLTHVDGWYSKNKNYVSSPISYRSAFIVGLFQCFALIPGVSRSAATIFGGLSQKMNWKQATEFSFFLAVPTLGAASVYKLYKGWASISHVPGIVNYLILGNAISFVIALITVATFIKFVQKIGFRPFGIYRIAAGIIFFTYILRDLV
jgi:undecaprenyl-diphosphatase